MSKYRKINLSTIIIVCISVILLSLTSLLSFVSINSIKFLGKHSIELNEKSISNNAMLSFLEITRRTAAAYSIYFRSIENTVDILATQITEILNGAQKMSSLKQTGLKFNKYKNNKFSYFENNNYSCFYYGNETTVNYAEIQLNKLSSIIPLFKKIYEQNSLFTSCVWLQTDKKIYLEYPKYYAYKKIDIELMKKYFENLDLEYHNVGNIKKNKIIWTQPYKDVSNSINIDAYKIIYSKEGRFVASVGIDHDFNKILNIISNNSIFSDIDSAEAENIKSVHNKMKGFIFITEKDGSIILFPDKYSKLLSLPDIEYSKLKEYPDKLEVDLNDSLNPEIRQLAKKIENNEIGVQSVLLKGEKYIIAYKDIPSVDWVLCFATLEKSLMSSIDETRETMNLAKDRMIERFIIISLVFLTLFIVIAILAFRFYLLKPLNKLRKSVKEVGTGNFDISIDEAGFAEISDLSITFNSLTRELKEYTKNLETEVKQRQSIETELEIAAKLQESVLPKITDEFISDKFELYAKLVPAKEMSGDFYDFFYINYNTLCIVLADVCGKGITAAFYMSMAKAIIKEACLKSNTHDTGKIMGKINRILHSSVKKPMFLTMYLIFYNIDTGKIIYTNAGHHEYTLIDNKGIVNFNGESHNTFAGFFENIEYGYSEIDLKPGEVFALYTDGINDARNHEKIFYEDECLQKIFESTYKMNLQDICDSIIDDVIMFQSGNKADDITLVILKRKI